MHVLASAFARRTLGFLVAGLLALLVIVAATAWLAVRTGERADEVQQIRQLRTVGTTLLIALLDAETGQRGFLLTSEADYLAPYESAGPRTAAALAQLRRLALEDRGAGETVAKLEQLIERKLAEMARTIELKRSGHLEEALDIVQSNRGRDTMDEIREVLNDLIARIEARVAAGLAGLTAGARILTWTTLAGASLILIFGAGAAATVVRYTRELVTARDQVERLNRDLEARVTERTADLTRANDEIQRFAYIVSHDLRSPLVNIMGFTSELEVGTQAIQKYIADEQPDPATAEAARLAASEDLPEAVRFIRASTSKMDRLINAILKLSREGRRELAPQKVDLARLVGNAVAAVQHQLDNAGARIEVGRRLPTIVSDRLALEQIVGNLIDNAVKYLSAERAGVITIDAERKHNRVLLSVADNGRGIDPKDHERIFELFRRAGAQDQPGEGIGLAHVRATVRRLGGEITVRSRLGVGSTFQLDLPMSPPSREPHSPEPTPRESTGAA